MLDRDIRPSLRLAIREDHPGASLFEEFPVCRKGRADMVAVNAAIWAYEIKSERDTLARLPLQVSQYEHIFDYSVLVAAERHLRRAEKLIPSHWGMVSVRGSVNKCSFDAVRKPERNTNRSIDDIIRLLWKSECVQVLRARGLKVPVSASMKIIWGMLGDLPIEELEESVRRALRVRHGMDLVCDKGQVMV